MRNTKQCNSSGQTQETANFDDCVSGHVYTAYSAPYDFDSIMHYDLGLWLIQDGSCPRISKCENENDDGRTCKLKEECMTMKPKDSSVIRAGARAGSGLSDIDKVKLKSAYGCDACGGHQFSLKGGRFHARSSPPIPGNYCDWILRTAENKQIILQFSVSKTSKYYLYSNFSILELLRKYFMVF